MGLHFRLEHANWLAHLIEPRTTLLPSLDERARKDLVEFLRLFEHGFFSNTREDKVIELSQRVADEVERHVRVKANALKPLRDLFKDTLWVALLIPSGMDEESDSILTHPNYLRKIVHGDISSGQRIVRVNPGNPGLILQLEEPPSTTVLLITTPHVTAGTSREFPDDRPRQSIAQRGDGIGHVTLGALGSREVCNLRVGKAFLIEWSFFWSRHV